MVIKMELVMPDKRAFRIQGDTLDELKLQEWFWNFLGVEMPDEYREMAIQTGMLYKQPKLEPADKPQQQPPQPEMQPIQPQPQQPLSPQMLPQPEDFPAEMMYKGARPPQPEMPPMQQQPPQQPPQQPQQPQPPQPQQQGTNNPQDQYVG